MRWIAVLLLFALLPCATAVKANFISDVWGIITDPFKLDKSTSNIIEAVERIAIHAERIEGRINADVEARLNQIDIIAKGAIVDVGNEARKSLDAASKVADRAFDRINGIQKEVFKSTADLVKCSTTVGSDIVLNKLSSSLNDFGLRRPRITIFGYNFLEVKFEKSDFDSPIGGFRKYKSLLDKQLANVSKDDHPTKIVDIYGEIQRNADLVRCHYKSDTGLFAELYEIELEYNRRERVWTASYILP